MLIDNKAWREGDASTRLNQLTDSVSNHQLHLRQPSIVRVFNSAFIIYRIAQNGI